MSYQHPVDLLLSQHVTKVPQEPTGRETTPAMSAHSKAYGQLGAEDTVVPFSGVEDYGAKGSRGQDAKVGAVL
jgi:hypothetical protein